MKFFSAFAGIGGFDKGIFNIIPDAECVGYSEIDRYAQRIYARHYPNHINFGDITRIDERKIPDCDLIVGGFPCQDISIAGKHAGLEGGRSGLFYDLIRIIQEKQPRTILLENVKGLFSSDKGRDFARVLIALDEAGYDVEWEMLNSKNFGVPQNRERVFIVGHLRGRSWTPVFPLGQGTCNTAESGEQSQDRMVSNCLDSNYYKGADGKRTMICISDSGKGKNIRRLIPLECERLQGYPDNWTKYGFNYPRPTEISDTQRYKCLGNSVTVNVIEAIVEKLKETGAI